MDRLSIIAPRAESRKTVADQAFLRDEWIGSATRRARRELVAARLCQLK
jgi:hypothetical protein